MKKIICISGLLVLIIYYTIFKSTIPGQILMHDVVVYTEGETYERAWNTYEKLPDKVQDMFEDNNYRMHVVDLIDNDENIIGQTIFGPRLVLLKNNGPYVERTTFHEFGHILDDELADTFISRSYEFMIIYNEEKENFKADNNVEYFISTPSEYFASAFSEYMTRPKRLKHNTPKTYEFIEQCLE